MARGVFVSRTEAENTTLSKVLDRYERDFFAENKERLSRPYGSATGKTILFRTARLPELDLPIWLPGETPAYRKFLPLR